LATLPRVEAHSITAKSPHFFPKVNIKVLKTKDPKIIQKKEEKLFVFYRQTLKVFFDETSNEFPPKTFCLTYVFSCFLRLIGIFMMATYFH
jgi:hypothetical protein